MHEFKEMEGWDYATAQTFFSSHVGEFIPETPEYIMGLKKYAEPVDLRRDDNAKETLLKALTKRSLILIDGCRLTGKTTLAQRLAPMIGAQIIDTDFICTDWFNEQMAKPLAERERFCFVVNANSMTEQFLVQNLEKIISSKSSSSVILVGSYLELIYRTIIAQTLGKYFEQIVSVYCTTDTFAEMLMLNQKHEKENKMSDRQVFSEHMFSQNLLNDDGAALGFGMDHSFISNLHVSNMFAYE